MKDEFVLKVDFVAEVSQMSDDQPQTNRGGDTHKNRLDTVDEQSIGDSPDWDDQSPTLPNHSAQKMEGFDEARLKLTGRLKDVDTSNF